MGGHLFRRFWEENEISVEPALKIQIMRVGSLMLILVEISQALMSSCEPRPQLVQTLLSMLGLQEERVAHPRVRDVDSRARRVDAPPRQSFSPNFQQQQQSFNLAGKMQQPLFGQTKKVATSNNNNFQDSRSSGLLGGEVTPNSVCSCTCCPCFPCAPGEEDCLQYID